METRIKPAFTENNIPIFFSCSEQFVPHTAAAIQSLMVHASGRINYDIIILHTGVSKNSQRLLQIMAEYVGNFSVRFWDVNELFRSKELGTYMRFTVEVFYRLVIPWLLECPKAIYLDSDLVVQRDIADLFDVDIGDNLLGAVVDATIVGEYSIPEIREYHDKVLSLKNPYSYFNSGVLVFNIPAFRSAFKAEELLDFAQKRTYRYVDQDVLNAKCGMRTCMLDMKWNVMTDHGGTRIDEIARLAPSTIYQTYLESRENPYIIHYAGGEKPWNNPQSDFAEVYWKYARQTPFYEATLYRMMCSIAENHGAPPADNRSGARRMADRILPKGSRRRNLAKKILPKGSKRWNFFKRIYWKILRR